MNELFINILGGINSVLGNYGWSIVVFTIIVRIVLLPLDYKSRVGMRKTALIQPKIQALQKKYAKDQEKLNQKMAELYKKEKVNPMSSCLPLLLSYPILIMMFNAMRAVANQSVVNQVLEVLQNPGQMPALESWLWIKNVWQPDSPFASALPDLNMLRQVTADVWTKSFAANPEQWSAVLANYPQLAELSLDTFTNGLQNNVQTLYTALASTEVYVNASGSIPGWTFNLLLAQLSIMKEWNGLFILPLFSASSQLLMTKLNPAQPAPNTQQNNQQQSTMNFMNWFFPLFTLWICSSSNGMFALYWVTGNIIMMVETWGINKYLDMKDKTAQPVEGEGAIK